MPYKKPNPKDRYLRKLEECKTSSQIEAVIKCAEVNLNVTDSDFIMIRAAGALAKNKISEFKKTMAEVEK